MQLGVCKCREYGAVLPCDILLVWFESNECAEEIADLLDGLDGEILNNQMKEKNRDQLHLQHLLSVSHTVATKGILQQRLQNS